MKLEEALKQKKPFESEIQKLLININFTSSWFNALFLQTLKPFDITPAQFNVLRILKGAYPESYCNQQITERMVDRSSNSTRIVDKLLKKKLIVRKEHKADRRLVDIKITPLGLDLLQQIEVSAPMKKMKVAQFNAEKAKLMNEWLDEMRM
ncbi:MAG: MarR family transcriptional regulator [Bacteroidota bacterium]